MKKVYFFYILIIFLLGCAGKETKRESVKVHFAAIELNSLKIHDDLEFKNLKTAIASNIEYWSQSNRRKQSLHFGEEFEVSAENYLKSLKALKLILEKNDKEKALQYLRDHFIWIGFQSKEKKIGSTFVTSYFEPVIKASYFRSDKFNQALYGIPHNLINIKMELFASTFSHWKIWEDMGKEQKSKISLLRGRLRKDPLSSDGILEVVPFYNRQQIDEFGLLSGEAPILAYMNPIDAFFLQVQGSGVIEFQGGEKVHVGYAAQNGYTYTAIGKLMFSAIPKSEMSLQNIENYLHQLSHREVRNFLNKNESYVFFRKLEGRGVTYMGTEVVDGRTIASDAQIFPKGVLAYLSFETTDQSNKSLQIARFVIDQDTGGAIRGPHRVDLFWGQGEPAKQIAGRIQSQGRILYLIPKEDKVAH